jgi:hypothetical protein
MAYRVFASPDGAVWQAWDVPGRDPADLRDTREAIRPAMEQGWICFECGGEKRRLTPIPARWAERSDAELWLYCRVAERAEPSVFGNPSPPLGDEPAAPLPAMPLDPTP